MKYLIAFILFASFAFADDWQRCETVGVTLDVLSQYALRYEVSSAGIYPDMPAAVAFVKGLMAQRGIASVGVENLDIGSLLLFGTPPSLIVYKTWAAENFLVCVFQVNVKKKAPEGTSS
jgi:hypothetical protein